MGIKTIKIRLVFSAGTNEEEVWSNILEVFVTQKGLCSRLRSATAQETLDPMYDPEITQPALQHGLVAFCDIRKCRSVEKN